MNTRKLLLALLVIIAYFSVGFAVQSVHTDNVSALKFQGRSAPSLSPAGSGVLYFDGTHFQASENGGAYATLGGGGGLTVGTSAVTSGTGGRVFYETAGNKLGEISGATSDGTTLTLVAPVLGAATATSVNGLVVSTTTGTFTLTNAKTFAVTNSLTLSGTDSTVMTFPGTSATIARTDAAQSFTGTQTISVIQSVAGAVHAISTQAAAQTASTTAGLGLTITAAPAVAGSANAGAATGGSITEAAGNAARFSSGNAKGGDINLTPGSGIGTGTTGQIFAGVSGTAAAPVYSWASSAGYGIFLGINTIGITANTVESLRVEQNKASVISAQLTSAGTLGWGSTSAIGGGSADLILSRRTTANLNFGAADAASPVAQILSFQGGSGTDIAAVNATVVGPLGTGAGTNGDVVFQTGVKVASGTGAPTKTTALTLRGETQASVFGGPSVLKSYTVSALPSAATIGAGGMAFVTDSTATAITGLGLAVSGGGSNKVVVYSDGTNWLIL